MKTLLIGLLALGSISAFGYNCGYIIQELEDYAMKQSSLNSKVWVTVVQNDQWIQSHIELLREIPVPPWKQYCFWEHQSSEFNEQVLKFKTDREEIHRRLEEINEGMIIEDKLDRIISDLKKHCTGKILDEEM